MTTRLNTWKNLSFLDPERVSIGLYEIAKTYPLSSFPYQFSSLRRRDVRHFGEGRQAALFCYAMSKVVGAPVWFAQAEASDYDIVTRFRRNDVDHYAPVQLKELVPARVNAEASLQGELDKLSKYVDSVDLIVAFHVNRDMRLELGDLRLPRGAIAQLWLYAATAQDQSKWVAFGDLLSPGSGRIDFIYPGAEAGG
jgi:hypothetical protein